MSWQRSLLFSFIGSLIWGGILMVPGHPTFTLRPDLQDHVSNTYMSLVFWKKGFQIQQEGPENYLDHDLSPNSQSFAKNLGIPSDDVLKFRDGQGPTPLLIVWPWMPRPYPVGCFLFFTPFGALIQSGVSPPLVFALVIFSFLLIAHLCFFLILPFYLEELRSQSRGIKLLAGLLCLFIYQELILWACQGMYDGVGVTILVMSFISYSKKNWFACIAFFCLAFFIHYRALFWAPLPILALWSWTQDPRRNENLLKISPVQFFLIGIAVCLGLFSLWTFHLTWLSLHRDYNEMKNNRFFLSLTELPKKEFFAWIFLLIPWSWFSLKHKQIMTWSCVLWATIVLTSMPFVKAWYLLFLTPFLFLPLQDGLSPLTKTKLRLSNLALYAYLGGCVFSDSPCELYLWKQLFHLKDVV